MWKQTTLFILCTHVYIKIARDSLLMVCRDFVVVVVAVLVVAIAAAAIMFLPPPPPPPNPTPLLLIAAPPSPSLLFCSITLVSRQLPPRNLQNEAQAWKKKGGGCTIDGACPSIAFTLLLGSLLCLGCCLCRCLSCCCCCCSISLLHCCCCCCCCVTTAAAAAAAEVPFLRGLL